MPNVIIVVTYFPLLLSPALCCYHLPTAVITFLLLLLPPFCCYHLPSAVITSSPFWFVICCYQFPPILVSPLLLSPPPCCYHPMCSPHVLSGPFPWKDQLPNSSNSKCLASCVFSLCPPINVYVHCSDSKKAGYGIVGCIEVCYCLIRTYCALQGEMFLLREGANYCYGCIVLRHGMLIKQCSMKDWSYLYNLQRIW